MEGEKYGVSLKYLRVELLSGNKKYSTKEVKIQVQKIQKQNICWHKEKHLNEIFTYQILQYCYHP